MTVSKKIEAQLQNIPEGTPFRYETCLLNPRNMKQPPNQLVGLSMQERSKEQRKAYFINRSKPFSVQSHRRTTQ